MNILSLNFGHDGLAAIFKDGKLAGAIATERLTRVKKARGVNWDVIQYVLKQAGLAWTDIHLVVITNWFYDRGRDGKELFDKAAAGVAITKANGQPLSVDDWQRMHIAPAPAWGFFAFSIGNHRAPCLLVYHH